MSEAIRDRLTQLGCEFVSSPVSGNGKTVKAGKLSTVVSGPKAAFEQVQPYLAIFMPSGVSYVGEGELARICKIAHNVFLGVVIENLAERSPSWRKRPACRVTPSTLRTPACSARRC